MGETERQLIVAPGMPGLGDGSNINGPSCIAVPDWVEGRLGRYYLYFAHHRGDHIRLAWADAVTGPWTMVPGGVLPLAALGRCVDHVASPDVVIDHAAREIRLYYHGVDAESGRQATFLALSRDGLHFTPGKEPLADFYLRVAAWRGRWIGMSKGGALYLSEDGKQAFRRLPAPAFPMSGPGASSPGDVRHVALDLDGDRLWVMFTRIGDRPEHLRLGYVDLLRAPDDWRVEEDAPLLSPRHAWEGADLPVAPSRDGAAGRREHALRDPAVLRAEGRAWLFYACAGEQGIALAPLPDLGAAWLGAERQATWTQRDIAAGKLSAALHRYRQPGALAARLAELDGEDGPRRRIYLMGCGRSGTWLLTSLMGCFAETEVVAQELPVEMFGVLRTARRAIVVKREWNAFARPEAIPEGVAILHIVRHPFDVLTSHNPASGRKRHISPERWLDEMAALRRLLGSGRKGVLVVRYEDLVTAPDALLARIGQAFGLAIAATPDEALARAQLPEEGKAAMHGLRAIDRHSVGRFRHDAEALAYLREVAPSLRDMLDWAGARFGYDLSLGEPALAAAGARP